MTVESDIIIKGRLATDETRIEHRLGRRKADLIQLRIKTDEHGWEAGIIRHKSVKEFVCSGLISQSLGWIYRCFRAFLTFKWLISQGLRGNMQIIFSGLTHPLF